MAFVKHRFQGDTQSIYELGSSTLIGRSVDNQIVINDPTVSACHAKIVQQGEVFFLSDQKSTNGILIGGQKVTECEMVPGLIFVLGAHEFEFLMEVPKDFEQTLKIKKSWIPGVYYTE